MVIAQNAEFTVLEIVAACGRSASDIGRRISARRKAGLISGRKIHCSGSGNCPFVYTYDEVKQILWNPKNERNGSSRRRDAETDPQRVAALRHQLVTDGFTVT